MSMDGKRFGMGLAAGLLFALLVVGAAGVASSGGVLPASHVSGNGPSAPAASTSEKSATTTTSGPILAYNTTGQAPPTISGNQSDLSSLSSGTSSTSSSTSTGPSITFGANQGSSGAPAFSSSLASMGQLSTQSRALLLAPIIVAILIGALLYRVSRERGPEKG